MKNTLSQIILPFVAILAGLALIYAGAAAGWGRVWIAAGIFFITIGISAILLSLAWVLPGIFGAILRHPISNVIILLAVLLTMGATVVLGVMEGVR